MKAIRGATTVENDDAEEIRQNVSELLKQILLKNNLHEDDIICIMFSNTNDIRSFYPAKAAREAGLYSCALFSSLEPDICGSLTKCIRVMLLVETDKKPVYVYLNRAVNLRKDLADTISIALDGPAGSGKSTVSKIVAKKLNILYLDTGAMYRACALGCLNNSVSVTDEKAVSILLDSLNIEVKYVEGNQRTYLNGKDVSDEIRKPEISMAASTVSALGCVRKKMVELQRKIAAETSCILDGRDIGTNVLPNATYKFYLTASAEERARRRSEENKQKDLKSDYNEILADILKRDEQDKTRTIAPLKVADDAIVIDSSKMSINEVVKFIERKIQEKI